MKRLLIAAIAFGAAAPSFGNTLLFSDNFNTADTGNFDGAPLDGRRSGTLGNTIRLAAELVQQGISANKLRMVDTPNSDGRVRFQDATTGVWLNWADGATGTSILADGGLRVEFDWFPTNNSSDNWIAFNIGHDTTEPASRVNHAATDYGILLRNPGGSQRFVNGASLGNGTPFDALPATEVRHVVLDYSFSSFADGTTVAVRTAVNGAVVATDSFTWAGNGGALYMELGTDITGSLIDNFAVSTKPGFAIELAGNEFASGAPQGTPIGSLTAAIPGGNPEGATFTFVTGEGSTDNNLFQISGSTLKVGNYNFTADPAGTSYSIRVHAVGSTSGASGDKILNLSMIEDDDFDALPDAWEFYFTGDILTDLSGKNGADYDGDGLTDLEEYQLSLNGYPDINPMNPDTDGDGLSDFEERQGADSRPPTDPTRPDTDNDEIDDLAETATGNYVSDSNTGTDPTLADSDGDGSRDGFELQKGSNPNDVSSRPALPASVKLGLLTDDASTGISTAKTYTHAISGGATATINGVSFATLTPTETPVNFSWDFVSSGTKGFIVNNAGNWNAASGGVTGTGLLELLGSFTFPTGKTPGGYQSYRLSGLTAGKTYETRIYLRTWNPGGTGRPIDFTFVNGTEEVVPFGALLADRPHVIFDNSNPDAAYYVSFTYTAQSTEMEIRAAIPLSESADNEGTGGLHLYGLTNEDLAGGTPASLKVTAVSRNGSGQIVVSFTGAASTSYQVTKSSNLAGAFVPLTIPLTATTDAGGIGQAIIPASEASEAKEFYRIEN